MSPISDHLKDCFYVFTTRKANTNLLDDFKNSILHNAVINNNYSAVLLILESDNIDFNV